MKKLIGFLFIGFLFISVGCRKRLDSFLFNGEKVEAYLLDNYSDGELSDLPNSYFVPKEDIHQFKYKIIDNGEELNIAAIYVGKESQLSQDTIILYCHGNAKHMDNYWNRQKLLRYAGGNGRYGVLMFDYPGYGMSDGKPTEENMYEAANGALKWLKNKGVTNDRLVIYGYSLGSAPATRIASNSTFALQPSKLILEAPFASSEVMVQDASLVNMPASYFVDVEIDNAEQIKQCVVPLLWIHGINDDFLSIESHGRLVYNNHYNSWKRKIEVLGAGHSDVPTFIGYEQYANKIHEFIKQD
ncbi:MAG: alpha/beta hydrolase [Brumimicrobium sp.]